MIRPCYIKLHMTSRYLELIYADQSYQLSCEYLRVFSPSAEVRGHPGQAPALQVGKIDVIIKDIKTVGNYALKFTFSDNHDSGLYSWNYLYDLAVNQEKYWTQYLARLVKERGSRQPDEMIVNIVD